MCLHELVPLWSYQYEETGKLRTQPYCPDFRTIVGYANAGNYALYTIRMDDVLVGYSIFTINRLAQHAKSIFALNETIYIVPELRKQLVREFFELVSFAEVDLLEKMKVNAIRYYSVPYIKAGKGGLGKLFKFIGARPVEVAYEKALTPHTAGKWNHGRRSSKRKRTDKSEHATER